MDSIKHSSMTGPRFCLLVLFLVMAQCAFTQRIEQSIQSSADDAEEKYDGSYITTSSSDIEMVYDDWNDQGLQIIGLRFSNIKIPANSKISKAYLQFTADGAGAGDINMTIKGEAAANASAFSNFSNNISNRSTTTSSVQWTPTTSWADNQSEEDQRTPDLSAIVSEIISSKGWQNGNAMSFIISGNGGADDYRKAYSFDEDPAKAAKLIVEFASLSDVDLALNTFVLPTEVSFPNSASKVQLEITSYGNIEAKDYTVSYSINGKEVAMEQGTVPLNVGQTVTFTFAQTADLSTLGKYDLKAEISVDNDEDVANNSISKSISVIKELDKTYFDKASAWRYLDANTDPGPDWYTIDFDDSEWLVGAGQFGFGQGDEASALASGRISYYFRKKIEVADTNELDDMYIHLVHDDAAIVYINGKEALRSELMPTGAITHATTARQYCNASTNNEFYTYKIDPSLFVSGINTIAVSVRNRNMGNADLSFDAYMSPTFTFSQDGPYVSYSGNDIIVDEVTPDGLLSTTYTSKKELQLTCHLPHMNTSFSFPLKKEITIEPCEYLLTPSKFLTISDFDGHIEAFTMLLRGEGVIDKNFNWVYGDGHLIITGDLFDRGFHVTECMWLLYKLEAEAEANGGKVHLVIGNHEIFNLTDDWRYAEVKYFNSAHLMGKRMPELYNSKTELGRWLRSKNIIERIGEYAFAHGGISPEVSSLNLNYQQINDYGRMEMQGNCTSDICETVTGSEGIYWYRGMVKEELSQQQVDDILNDFGVKRIILGHTKGHTIRSLYNERVLAIDMYHVNNFSNGYMEALQFELGCFYLFHTDETDQTYTLLGNCDELDESILELNGENQLQIFPNPTVSTLTVGLPPRLLDYYNYTIIDQQGRIVGSGEIDSEFTSIPVGQYQAGKYLLTLQNAEQKITGFFILNK